MTACAQRLVQPRESSRSLAANAPSDLLRTDCNLALWRRPVPRQVTKSLSMWAERDPVPFEATVSSPNDNLSHAWSALPKTIRAWLEADVRGLLNVFFDLARPSSAALKFGVIGTDQCRKFHVDYLRYRLITTYVGLGTEWIPDRAVNRAMLGVPPEDPKLANAVIVKDARAVQHAVAGDVLLMKGARHEHGVGLVHRSPPIEHVEVRRVVLVVSTIKRSTTSP